MSREQVVVRLAMKQTGMIAVALSLAVLVAAYLAESKLVIVMSLINLFITILLTKAFMKG